MPADPVAAGRKGGQSRSAAKIAAAQRNGFQRLDELTKSMQAKAAKGDPMAQRWLADKAAFSDDALVDAVLQLQDDAANQCGIFAPDFKPSTPAPKGAVLIVPRAGGK